MGRRRVPLPPDRIRPLSSGIGAGAYSGKEEGRLAPPLLLPLLRRALVALVAAAAVALIAVAVAAVAAVSAWRGAGRACAVPVVLAAALVVVRAGLAALAVRAGRAGVLALAGVVAVVVAVVVAAGEHGAGAADHEASGHHRDDQGPAHRGSPCSRAGLAALRPGHGGGLDPIQVERVGVGLLRAKLLDHVVELFVR